MALPVRTTRLRTRSVADTQVCDPSKTGRSSWTMVAPTDVPLTQEYNGFTVTGRGYRGRQVSEQIQSRNLDPSLDPWLDALFHNSPAQIAVNSHLVQDGSDSITFDPVEPGYHFTSGQTEPSRQILPIGHYGTDLVGCKYGDQQGRGDGYGWPMISQPYQPFDPSESLLASSYERPSEDNTLPSCQIDYVEHKQQLPWDATDTSTQDSQRVPVPTDPYHQQFSSASQTDVDGSYNFLKPEPDPEPDLPYPPLPTIAPDEDLETFLMSSLAEHHNPQLPTFESLNISSDIKATKGDSIGYGRSALSIGGQLPTLYRHTRHASPPTSHGNLKARYTGGFARDPERDQMMLQLKDQGMSYKDIKVHLGFDEAESTLRGRYRTMTKPRAERVRKPGWNDRDVRILKEAVSHFLKTSQGNTPAASSHSRRQNDKDQDPLDRIPWKNVAEYMKRRGCYRYGNSTVKKKYHEVTKASKSGDG